MTQSQPRGDVKHSLNALSPLLDGTTWTTDLVDSGSLPSSDDQEGTAQIDPHHTQLPWICDWNGPYLDYNAFAMYGMRAQSVNPVLSSLHIAPLTPRISRHGSFISIDSSSSDASDFLSPSFSPSSDINSPASVNGVSVESSAIAERFDALTDDLKQLFRTCGNDLAVQHNVLDVLESSEFKSHEELPFDLVSPLLEYGDKGKRGAPTFYTCKWGTCGERVRRKLHAREHIMAHVNNRPHVCPRCGSGFVRKNELKKHQVPCEQNKTRRMRNLSVGSKPMRAVDTGSPSPSPALDSVSPTSSTAPTGALLTNSGAYALPGYANLPWELASDQSPIFMDASLDSQWWMPSPYDY